MLAYWKLTLSLVCSMITAQYYVRVFTSRDTLERLKQQKSSKFCLSGLVLCQTDPTPTSLSLFFVNSELKTLKLYMPYVGLLLAFVIAYFILVSRNYQSLMDYYIEQEVKLQKRRPVKSNPDENHSGNESEKSERRKFLPLDDDEPASTSSKESGTSIPDFARADFTTYSQAPIDIMTRQQLKDSIVMVDPITRVFVKNALYLLLASMAFVISTLPVSLTNVVLLFFMTAIVVKALLFKSSLTLYQDSTILLRCLNIFTIVAIAARYWVQFYRQIDTQVAPEINSNEKLIAIVLGHKIDMFAVRLLGLTLILVITRIQLMMVNNQALIKILKEEEANWDKSKRLARWQKVLHTVSYVLYQILPFFTLATIILYSVLWPSLLGLIGILLAIIVLKVY
jgi:hypothetical protein